VTTVSDSRLRSLGLGVAIAFVVMVAATAIAFSLIAVPLHVFARDEPGNAVDGDAVRMGLVAIALPVGVVAGIVSGALVSRWHARGGRLPRDRTLLHDT
jgi:hypothetical protein